METHTRGGRTIRRLYGTGKYTEKGEGIYREETHYGGGTHYGEETLREGTHAERGHIYGDTLGVGTLTRVGHTW